MNQPLTAVTDHTLDDLSAIYLATKENLKRAQQAVDDAAQAIIDRVGVEREGSFTVRCDHYKVTTTQPIARTVNKTAAIELRREIPEDIWEGMFDFKPSLNVRLFKDCEDLRPDVFKAVCRAITSKPGKPQLRVEVLEAQS
jgi:hypothetical protein